MDHEDTNVVSPVEMVGKKVPPMRHVVPVRTNPPCEPVCGSPCLDVPHTPGQEDIVAIALPYLKELTKATTHQVTQTAKVHV